MQNNNVMDEIRKVINSSNSDFKVDKFKIGSCGYIGNVFYTKNLPNINDPYRIATELIQNEVIYEIKIVDLSRCSVYYFYRDYDSGIGDKIRIINESFDKYAKFLHKKRDVGNVFLSIVTLAIEKEELEKISKLNTYMELIDCLEYTKAISKPKPNVRVENAYEEEMVALINYYHQDFKIEQIINWDDFYDGYYIEGYVQGDTKETVLQLVSNSRLVSSGRFIKDEQCHFIPEYDDFYIDSSIWFPKSSKLGKAEQNIALHGYLELDELKDIHRMDNFKHVIQYLMKKERSPDPTFDEIQSLDDGEILPF